MSANPTSRPASPLAKPPSPVALLWRLMRGHRALYGCAILALLAQTVVGYVVPLVVSGTIDYAISAKPAASGVPAYLLGLIGGSAQARNHLWIPALAIVLLTVLAGAFQYLKGRWAALASEGIARRLKNRLYSHLQQLPSAYHDRADTGDLIQRCTSDVETLRLALASQVVEVGNTLFLVLTAIPVMIVLDPRMAIASFVLVGPIFLYGFFYFGRVKHLFRQIDEAEGQVTRLVQENLTGLRVVRAFARQEFEIGKFAGPNQLYRDRSLRMLRAMAWYWSSSDLIALCQQGVVLFVGIHFIAQGTLTVGTLFAFLMFLNILLWPMRQMGRTLTDLGKSVVALSRLGEILDVPEESISPTPAEPLIPAMGRIEVRDLRFAHSSEQTAIDGISFTVEPGQTLAIMGPSGAGKSTLLHLLLRLYDYQGGSIRFDGRELSDLDRRWVRAQFSVVMQEPFLYSKTIGENIQLGHGAAEAEEIATAAQLAHIHETISTFPSGYETLVGERGITLSGGQRQRVALARALLRDAPVLLLDDAMSAVDAETESIILDALRRRHGKRTTLVIAHRLSTLAWADHVMVLDHGKIIQHGTHAELVASDGLYGRLWEVQNASPDFQPTAKK